MSSEYTVKQIATALNQPTHAVRFVLKQVKHTLHEGIHPTLQFYKFEDLPEKYRMALQPTHTDKNGHTSFGCGTIPIPLEPVKQTPPKVIDEQYDDKCVFCGMTSDLLEVQNADDAPELVCGACYEKHKMPRINKEVPTVEDDQVIYGEGILPFGALPELSSDLIYAFKEIFGIEKTANILRNNYQVNPN